MKFYYIAPNSIAQLGESALGIPEGQLNALALAHLVEDNPTYLASLNSPEILDNSAFELFQQGRPMYSGDKMIEMGTRCSAKTLVMPDYPGEPRSRTIEAAEHYGQLFHDAGFKTFFVPQGLEGDLDDLMEAFAWAACSHHVDTIGVSILACPNAFGVRDNRLQRYLSRLAVFRELDRRGILNAIIANGKKIHCLGMTEGPQEISLLRQYLPFISSWDSSSPIWHGCLGIRYDGSPTGLLDGKTDVHVDFDWQLHRYHALGNRIMGAVQHNISFLENIING